MKKVALTELHVYARMVPLVSGYLQAYAQADPHLAQEFTFHKYSMTIDTPADDVANELIAADANVYAFSCYVWNMGLVRRIAALVRAARPDSYIVLGGPQVMRHARNYLRADDERMIVCNGEGEITFSEYLRTLVDPFFDLPDVQGISFYRAGQLTTTEDRPRIKDLESIPSPYLSGVFTEKYTMSIIETNRGCPFHCGFCYWGAATNDKVYRFDEQRVRDEITWMAQRDFLFLYIADANWGMLGRDIDISQHIADCARQYSSPNLLYFSAAKNKPHAVSKIAAIFQDAGLVSAQPVSMQTLEPESLRLIERSNIKLDAFKDVQESLRERGIGSFVELIWPLPGETLDSFKRGISTLCENNAQSLMIYPHLLLNNTPLSRNQEKLGLVIRPAWEGVSEANLVVATAQVSQEDFAEGMRIIFAVSAIHNSRALYSLSRYLNRTRAMTYAQLFVGFVEYWKAQSRDDPISGYVERSISEGNFYTIENNGLFTHTVMHLERRAFGRQLRAFAQQQPWWSDAHARALFEVDMVNRPYIYNNTPLDLLDDEFEAIRVLDRQHRTYTVEVRPEYADVIGETLRIGVPDKPFVVDHRRKQYPFMPGQEPVATGSYCHGIIEKVENLMPAWQTLAVPV